MALLSCNDLVLGYEGKTVLSGVNFAVEPGMYLCIVGENGSGKSTLTKALLGAKAPMSGSITFGEGLRQNEIGYLPQQTQVQKDFPASVEEIVLSGRLNQLGKRLFYNKADRQTVQENMKLLGIEGMRHACYQELSGGQQQRVLLARALCATSRLLVLDEPAAGLDPVVTAGLYALIRQLNQVQQLTVVMVSHDVRTAVKNASHVLHLGRRQLFFGTAQEYEESSLGNAFLGGDDHD